jgi:polysaccharide export outer membrane protein
MERIAMKSFLYIIFLFLILVPDVLAGDYLIGDGDTLDISVWGVPELSGPVTVRPDGKITLNAAGDIVASGLSPAQLSATLTEILKDYVKKPIITVRVTQITNNKVYVSGDGVPSSTVFLTGRSTLFQLLCSLPNLEKGDLRRAYLIRDKKRINVNFHALLMEGDFSQDLDLKANDILFIPSQELSKIYVLGAVKEPKFIYFRDGMKVLDAIIEAGGFSEYAKANSVTVHRGEEQKIEVLGKELLKGRDTTQNIPLQPGDYVTVEEGIF